jgi:hypothetical protein
VHDVQRGAHPVQPTLRRLHPAALGRPKTAHATQNDVHRSPWALHEPRKAVHAAPMPLHPSQDALHAWQIAPHASPAGLRALHVALHREYCRSVDKRSKVARQQKLKSTVKAVQTRLAGTSPVLLAGVSYEVPELAMLLQEEIDAMKEVVRREAERRQAVAFERLVKHRNKPILVALENLVRGLYGGDVTVLSEFALTAPKKQKKSPAVKAEAAKKSKATRQVRRTMGKKQKKSAKG